MTEYSKDTIRRSAAQLLAFALRDVFPGVEILQASCDRRGFSCDYICEHQLGDHELRLLEERLQTLIKEKIEFASHTMMRMNAVEYFLYKKQGLQAALLEEEERDLVELLEISGQYFVCSEPHLPDAAPISWVKVLDRHEIDSESGAQRIEAVCFEDKKDCKQFVKSYRAGKKYDHVQMGSEQNLFHFFDDESLYWSSNGEELRHILINMWRKWMNEDGFSLIKSAKNEDESIIDFHAEIFKNSEENPQKLAELHHSEREQPASGLFGPIQNTSTYENIFCSPENTRSELISSLHFILQIPKIFAFESQVYLTEYSSSTLHSHGKWKKAQDLLEKILIECGISYEKVQDRGTALGPRVGITALDAQGRPWELSHLGFDLTQDQIFPLSSQKNHAKLITPAPIMRSTLASLEGLIALLLEKHRGDLPLYLTPEQVRLLPVTEAEFPAVTDLVSQMSGHGIRVKADYALGDLGKRVYAAHRERVPYVLVIGEKEVRTKCLSVRARSEKRATLLGQKAFTEQLLLELGTQAGQVTWDDRIKT